MQRRIEGSELGRWDAEARLLAELWTSHFIPYTNELYLTKKERS